MGQGKKWSQMKDSETFAFIGIMGIAILIFLLIIALVSCKSSAQRTPQEEEKVYININGENIELVADEYGNQYLKENAGTVYIYIPYPGETEDQSDTLHFYNAKNK